MVILAGVLLFRFIAKIYIQRIVSSSIDIWRKNPGRVEKDKPGMWKRLTDNICECVFF